MTVEYNKAKRLEDIAKGTAKMLRSCEFSAKANCNWEKGVFAVKVYNLSIEDYAGLLDYQQNGVISNEIQILRMA